ncbi:hypothetical protein FHW21_007135, partial [Paraburkholderia sp. WP4_3_2]
SERPSRLVSLLNRPIVARALIAFLAVWIGAHTQLRANEATPYERGLFYRTLLVQRLWPSQSALSRAMGISMSNLSRMLGLARIPSEIVDAMGGPKALTFRVGEVILATIDATGEKKVIERAREAVTIGYREMEDLLEYIVADRVPEQTFSRVRVRLARDRKSLRVDLPGIERLLPHLPALEDWLTTSLVRFEVKLATHLNASATKERHRRAP